MLNSVDIQSDASNRQNMQWLLLMRKVFVIAGSILIFITVYGVSFPIMAGPLWIIMLAYTGFNELIRRRLKNDEPVVEQELFCHLTIDVLGITAMLFFAGGATNPLAWYFLVPLMVTAIILPQKYAWSMVAITVTCYSLLTSYNIPLADLGPDIPIESLPMDLQDKLLGQGSFQLHVFGMWFGFVFSATVVAYFAVEMANTIRHRDHLLTQAREQALRDERVVSLGALAAGAAHELGTPLGTMAIVIHDLRQDYCQPEHESLQGKLDIVIEQLTRCKQALSVLSASAGNKRTEAGSVVRIADYLDELVDDWLDLRPQVGLEFNIQDNQRPYLEIFAEQTLSQALVNILNNAADASPDHIELTADWTDTLLTLNIRDHGPGLHPEVVASAGLNALQSTKEQGMGVGLLLAHATINRLGGTVKLFNPKGGGACVQVELPLLSKAL